MSGPVMSGPVTIRIERVLLGGLSLWLGLLAVVFIFVTCHWPVVSDAALMHFSVFLIRHGWAPYRDFLDVNMPGAYLVTAAGMQLPWSVDTGWRAFDLLLVALAGAGYYAIARPYSRFAALFATVMLLLVHGQDGIQQAGQRDLAMVVLLLAAVACLLEAARRNQGAQTYFWMLLFGLGMGAAATIKPTAGPMALVLLALFLAQQPGWRTGAGVRSILTWAAAGLTGLALPPGAMLLWLWRQHALGAWLETQRVLLPYYASLGRRPVSFTLLHSVSPLFPLVLLWLLCVVLRGPQWNPRARSVLITFTGLSLLALLVQGKTLPYQRYPMLAFLLLLISLDLTTALRARPLPRLVALTALGCGALVLAPLALLRVHRFAPTQEFRSLLASDLARVHADRDRQVQCLDTIQECLPTLYSLRVLPATGTLYDVFLFGDARQPAVRLARQRFVAELAADPPAAFVVVSGFFLNSSGGYSKLAEWPEFQQWLAQRYVLNVERTPNQPVRWWSRPQSPAGYRLYLARDLPRR